MARLFLSLTIVVLLSVQAFAQYGQNIRLYSGHNCVGTYIDVFQSYVPNLSSRNWNDVTQSVSATGAWILYDHANYNQGSDAATEYISNKPCANLQFIPGIASSIRFAGDKSNYKINSLTLYRSKHFQDDEEFISSDIPNVGLVTQSSLIITGSASWTLYDQPNYSGNSICLISPNKATSEPYFVVDMEQVINIPYNSIRSVRLGCI